MILLEKRYIPLNAKIIKAPGIFCFSNVRNKKVDLSSIEWEGGLN